MAMVVQQIATGDAFLFCLSNPKDIVTCCHIMTGIIYTVVCPYVTCYIYGLQVPLPLMSP